MEHNTEHITKPSIGRLARRSGVKSLSEGSYNTVRDLIRSRLRNIIDASLIANNSHDTATIMVKDVNEAMNHLGYNVTNSTHLGTTTCAK